MVMGAALPGYPTRAQPHEGNCERMSSRLHGCLGATNRIPVHGRGTTLPSPSKVQIFLDRNFQRNERSYRSPQYIQELDGATWMLRPCQMQSLRQHAKRPHFSLVQQTPVIVNLILQRVINRLPLHRSSDI